MPETPEQPPPPIARPAPAQPPAPAQAVEMASILFLDIVSYSTQPMDQQSRAITQLQQSVRGTQQLKLASARGDLLSLHTGDGRALVVFHDPVAPIQCAIEIAGALKHDRGLPLRMGVHSGPVYRHADIRDQLNVVGGGINKIGRA